MHQFLGINTCGRNDNLLWRSNDDLRRRGWGYWIYRIWLIIEIQVLRSLFLQLFWSTAPTTALDMKEDVSKYPKQIHNDDNQSSSFDDECPPVKLLIWEPWKTVRKMQNSEQDSSCIVEQRMKPSKPRLIRSNTCCPEEVQDKYQSC